MILALVDDLLFSSKIRAVAGHASRPVIFVRSAEALATHARSGPPDLILVDLDRAALDPIGAIRALKADPDLRTIRVVGFVSHVHADRIAEARSAGIDQVLARSAFVQALPNLVAAEANPVPGRRPAGDA